MRFLLDTGIMGDFINHRRGVDVRVRAERKNGAIIGTCVPVAGELFFGVEASRSRDINFARLVRALSASLVGRTPQTQRKNMVGLQRN